MIRVLVVDDSGISRDLLSSILASDEEIEVIGSAANGRDAVKLAIDLKPDVVTMDIHMPIMNGFEATKEIMIEAPTRIIIVSASTAVSELRWAMQALEVGALTLKMKPPGVNSPEFDKVAADLIDTVKALSDLHVVRHFRRGQAAAISTAESDAPQADSGGITAADLPPISPIAPDPIRIDSETIQQGKFHAVAIATSTGGPPALHAFLGQLPKNFPVPVLLVQHIAKGFVNGFASWLDSVIPMRTKLAEEGEVLKPGVVYVGPHDKHLGVSRALRVTLKDGNPSDSFCPSGDQLFHSCAESLGDRAVGIILTGMGRDGAEGMKALHAKGGKTFAQDEGTCVVFGMPRCVIAADAADFVLPIDSIAPRLIQLMRANE